MFGAVLLALVPLLLSASGSGAASSGPAVLQMAVDTNDADGALTLMSSSKRYDLQHVLLPADERSLYVATTLFLHRFDPADLRHASDTIMSKTINAFPPRPSYCPDWPLSRFTVLAEGPARDTLFYCQECIHENESAAAALPRAFGRTNTSFCLLLRWTGAKLEPVHMSDHQASVFDGRLRDQLDPPAGYRLGAVAFVLVDGSLLAFRGIEPTDAVSSSAPRSEPYTFLRKMSLSSSSDAGFLEREHSSHPVIFYSEVQLDPLHAFAHRHFVYIVAANDVHVPCARGRACVEPELHLLQHVPAAPRAPSDEWKSLFDLQLDYSRAQLEAHVRSLLSRQRQAPAYSLRLFVNSSVHWTGSIRLSSGGDDGGDPNGETLVGVLLEHQFLAPLRAPSAIDARQLERLHLYSLHLYSVSDAALNFLSTWLQCACPENSGPELALPQFMRPRQSPGQQACKAMIRSTKQLCQDSTLHGSTAVTAGSYEALVNQSRSYRDKVAAYANASARCGRLQPVLSAYLVASGAREWRALDEPLDDVQQEGAASTFRFTSATAVDRSGAGRGRANAGPDSGSRFALFLATDDSRLSEV